MLGLFHFFLGHISPGVNLTEVKGKIYQVSHCTVVAMEVLRVEWQAIIWIKYSQSTVGLQEKQIRF
jgi:hypothetical protein